MILLNYYIIIYTYVNKFRRHYNKCHKSFVVIVKVILDINIIVVKFLFGNFKNDSHN